MRSRGWVVAVAMVLACSEEDGGKNDASQPGKDGTRADRISEAELPQRFSDAMRAWDRRCCDQVGLGPPEGEAWPVREGARATFDPEAAALCIAEIEASACQLFKESVTGPESCGNVYTGTVALGEACFTRWDCAPSDLPDSYAGCLLGLGEESSVCTRVHLRKEGEDCAWSAGEERVECERPLLCDHEDDLCARPAKLGERCITGPLWGDTCEQGAVCDRTGTKRCVKPTPVGQACASIEDCEAQACVGGTCREPLFIVNLCRVE
jgi:hypothetical protein